MSRRVLLALTAIILLFVTAPGTGLMAVPARADTGSLTVTVTSVGDALLQPDQDLSVTATVHNGSGDPVTLSSATLEAQPRVPSNRTALLRFLADGRTQLATVAQQTSDRKVPAGKSVTLSFTVPRADLRWSTQSWGPHGIQVTVLADGTAVSDRSMVVAAPTSVTPTRAGVVVPVVPSAAELSALPGTWAGVNQAAEGEARSGEPASRLTDLLSTLTQPGVTAAVDPLFTATTATSGSGKTARNGRSTDAYSPYRAALAAFATSDANEVLYLPAGDADAAALTHAGNGTLLTSATAIAATAAQSIPGRADVALLPQNADAATVSAAAQAGATAVIIGANQGTYTQNMWWTPDAHSLVNGTADSGTTTGEAATGTANSTTTPAAGSTASTPAASTSTNALVADPQMSAALAGQLTADGTKVTLSALDARQMVLALSASAYLERPNDQRAQLLTVDRPDQRVWGADAPASAGADSALSAESMSATIAALMSAPWIQPSTVSELLDSEATSELTLPATSTQSGEATATEQQSVANAHAGVAAMASILADPAVITGPNDASLYRTLATTLRDATATRGKLRNAVVVEGRRLTSAVSVRPSSPINVIAENTELPVHVRNLLPMPVTVNVTLTAPDLRIDPQDSVTLTVPPASTLSASVPIRAAGSGNLTVRGSVSNSSGEQLGSSQEITVRVRSTWESTGMLVGAVIVAGVLVFGVVQSMRKGRRSQSVSTAPLEPRNATL